MTSWHKRPHGNEMEYFWGLGGEKITFEQMNNKPCWIWSRLCASVADSVESILNLAVSSGKGLLLGHQLHIQVYSACKKLWFKSSRETMVSTRGKIESDKSVLNSVWRMLIHINGDRNICKWIHWQRGLNITLHRRGGIITPILAWDSAVSDSSPCTLPANTKPLSLHWASPESLQFLASLEPELSLLLAQRLRCGLVESTKPPSPLDGHISLR